MKIKRNKKQSRSYRLPSWLKLRIKSGLENDIEWMIEMAEISNADTVRQSVVLKGNKWKATIQVKRIYDKKY